MDSYKSRSCSSVEKSNETFRFFDGLPKVIVPFKTMFRQDRNTFCSVLLFRKLLKNTSATLIPFGVFCKMVVLTWSLTNIFPQNGVKYLAHIVLSVCLYVASKILNFGQKSKPPQNINLPRSFLGLRNIYRHFVQNFAKVAYPLTNKLC